MSKEPKQYTDKDRKEIAGKLMRGLRDRMGVDGYIVSEGHGNSSDYEVALHDWPYQSVIVIRTPNTTKLAQITIRVVATARAQCGAVQTAAGSARAVAGYTRTGWNAKGLESLASSSPSAAELLAPYRTETDVKATIKIELAKETTK